MRTINDDDVAIDYYKNVLFKLRNNFKTLQYFYNFMAMLFVKNPLL
jgi:hypothetical protein